MRESDQRVSLKTERLLLRPFRLEDVEDVFAHAKDPEWARFFLLPIPQPYTRLDAEQFVASQVLASWSTNPAFAIVLNSVVVGGINLSINAVHKTAGLGYGLARVKWGMGLMPEAARAVIDWGFTEYGLAKVYARADLRNRRSLRVMEKLGMTREGVLRSHSKGRGERIDEVYYGLLREEWET
jgi:ribosomal-protein-alanine N-acetyltransferase